MHNRAKNDNGRQSKKAVTAREKIASLQADMDSLDTVEGFDYNDTNFSNYSEGQLNHDDVIDVAAYLISENEILRRIIGQKYPYIFVDEAQDTFENVVKALNKLCEAEGLPIVGYFGDPMQQIYDKRAGDFAGLSNSTPITKEENFRCSRKVIDLLNAFRQDVQQFPAGANAEIEGSAGNLPGCRLRYHGHDDFHGFSADRAGNCRSFFPLACKHPERIDPKRHLQEADEFLAARMEKTITSGPAKALWQHMEHEQIR